MSKATANAQKRIQASIRRRIDKMLEDSPDEVIRAVLESAFWPRNLNSMVSYSRIGDDDDGKLSVAFGPDADGHVEIISDLDPDPNCGGISFSHRFRTWGGGGESLRTRNALIVLATAMQLDGEENPQERRRQHLAEKLQKKLEARRGK